LCLVQLFTLTGVELEGYAEDVKPFERNAKIKTNRAYEQYTNESRLEDINNYVGAGGRKFSRQALSQFKGAELGLSTASQVAQSKGFNLPALDKLDTGVKSLKLEHLRLVEEIQKAQAGTLSPQEVRTLETDLITHTNQIVSTRGRIKAAGKAVVKVAKDETYQAKITAKKSLEANRGSWDDTLQSFEQSVIPEAKIDRQDTVKSKQSFEANRGNWDDLIGLDTIGSKAKDAATNLGGSLIRAGDRALTPHVNNLLSQVPGQPGVIDYGAGVDSLSQLSISDYGKMARLGLQGSAGVAQKAGAFLQGAENVALGLLPGGKAAKKLIQNTALPAAAFATATHFLPGGQVAAHALQGGLQGLLSLPGAGVGAAANGLIGSTIGSLPMLGNAAGAATSALVSGGIDLATSSAAGLLAPVLGGKLLLNAGQTAFNRIAPQQDNNKLLIAGQQAAQTALTLPQKLAEPAYEFVESGRDLLQAAGSKLISQSIEPLHPQLQSSKPPERRLQNNPGLTARLMPAAKPKTESPETTAIIIDIEAQNIGAKEAIEYAKKIQAQTKIGKEKLKEALKAGDKDRAEQIARILKNHLQIATTELDEIRKALGADAAMGTDAGNQLGQTKSVVTRASNDLNRSISKNKLNLDNESLSRLEPDPELETLSRKKQPRVRKYNPKQDPEGAGFEAIGFAKGAQDRFDRAEGSIKDREHKILQEQYGFQGIKKPYDPLQNLVTTKIDDAKTKLGDLRDVGAKVLSVFAGFAGVAFVGKMLTDWGSSAFQTASKMQSLETTVGAISSSSTKAQSSIVRSKAESDKLGYNILTGLEGDVAFRAATKDSVLETVAPDIMSGLKEYNRSRGVIEEKARLSQVAVVQMAGKDIRAEEVFGQLEEASPGAASVLARSMGMNINQLRKEMQFGTLNSNDALPRFGNQLSAEGMSGVNSLGNSAAVNVTKLQNSFVGLQSAAGDRLMSPTIEGLKAATAVTNTLKDNIDTLGKVFAASLLSAAASAVGLSAGLGLANPVLGFLIKNITLALPLLKTFALQTAVAYAAIEVFNTVMNSVNDSSPFKSLADDSEAAFAKISKGAALSKQSIEELKNEIYGKDRNVFQVIGDGVSGAFGGQTSITKKAADDTVDTDRILTQNESALKRQPPGLTEASRNRRSEIDLELSVIRSQNANLTSKDRDKIDINNKREQKLIEERSNLEKPINTRQAELQQVIKNANNIIDSPLRNDREKGLAKLQLAEAEKEQRKLQEQLVSSASTLAVGLRKVGEGLQSGLAAIDLASINRKTQTYLAATQDPRNTGGLAQANYTNTNTDLVAKQSLQQQAVSSLKSTINSSENRSTIQALGVDPESASQDQIDRLKSTVTDTRGQALLGYLSKYQSVKTELAQTNQSLFENQYSYVKSIADYNKGSIDQAVSLSSRLANLSITARSAISSLQQQVEQTLVEIDSTSSKAVFQAQRNKIQGAYNKFLEKLGISTDDIFEQIFTNYNSILDTVQQLTERRLSRQSSAITANYRQSGNETHKYQTQTEQTQGLQELQRQNVERQLSNQLNQFGSGVNQPVNTNSSSSNTNLQLYRSQKSGLIVPVVGATNSRGGGYKEDTGLDILTPIGSKVVASASGSLEYAEEGHVRQIGEDVDPTTPGFQKQKSIRVKLDTPVEYQGKKYDYQYYTHLRGIDPSIFNKGTHSRTPGSQQPIRIEAGQYLGETGTAGGGPHLHTGFSADREQRNHLNYQQVHDVLFGTKDTSRNAVGKVIPVQQNNAPIAQSAPQAPQFQNNDVAGTVTSSTYTPGGGGMNGAEKDSRGNRLTRNDYAIAIPGQNRVKDQIPYGSIVKLNYNGKTVNAKVTDGGPYVPGRQMDMTTAAAKALGFDGVGQVGVSLQSLPKSADPNKKYYFGEATYKPRFGKGGSVSNAEANKAIASVVRGDKYLTLGGGTQSEASNPQPQSSNPPPAGKGMLGDAILNNIYQQGVDQEIGKNSKLSNEYVGNVNRLSDRDTELTKKKHAQERNLYNQQEESDRTKLDTQILQNQNQLNRNLPGFNRKSVELENQSAAYNRSFGRTPYRQIDRVYQQYGGIPETATLDTSVTDSQSSIERLKEESRVRRENLLKQIQSIEAQGAGWANLKKTIQGQAQALKKNGFNDDATALEDFIQTNDKAIGTPKARQQTIDKLSKQYRALPSDGVAVYAAIAPGANKVLSDNKNLLGQYLPKTFDNQLKAEARSIVERFKSAREALEIEFNKLNEAIGILESEIQAKFKAKGYAPQKLDLTDPKRVELMRKIAPDETAALEQATDRKLQVNSSGQNLDRNAETAAARSVSIGSRREQLQVAQANTNYLATTQDGNLFSQIQIDKQRFTQGKTDLDLQFEQGAISADLYTAKLKQLGLETNTLRNAIQPLRGMTTGFFDDIFKGQGVFDGLGNAMRNLTINILKNFQDLISKHLGQQLFGSLEAGASDLQGNVASGQENGLVGRFLKGVGLINPGSKPNTTAGLDIGLNQPIIPNRSEGIGSGLVGSLTGMGLNLGMGLLGLPSIPGFADGGMVSSPTLALVGEGIHNEAIVPLPNGRSIPVDLKGAGESSGSGGNISNAISVTIQNSGQAKETSRGDATAIANLVQNLVTQGLINERRPGGLLS
jgi:tape measure domain-containing protein